MLDRTIPFYNIILRCDHYEPQEITLPDGYEIVSYRKGDEQSWAELEAAIGDFESTEEAKAYFISTYLKDENRWQNILFLLDPKKQIIGSCIAWDDLRDGAPVSSLHWLVVDEANQGKGFGRALSAAVMNLFAKREGMPVYIHTQPWSWKAILLYLSMGFRIQKTDTFSHYENQYELAMKTLEAVVDANHFEEEVERSIYE